ncbi:MAG TPA: type I restriction enzyme HsdR N-terminal domain-containing protein, partial [Pseudoduganella sp.]
IMLFECKKYGSELDVNHAGQLFRYFHVTAARFGVLTNGSMYRFFTDLEQPNKMDEKPFFEFDLLDFKERDVEELKKFAKSTSMSTPSSTRPASSNTLVQYRISSPAC